MPRHHHVGVRLRHPPPLPWGPELLRAGPGGRLRVRGDRPPDPLPRDRGRHHRPEALQETRMKVEFSYLRKQFANPKPILKDVEKLVKSGDFTLGKAVGRFEEKFAKICGTRYAVGVNSGTDALFLSLKALGVGPGHEVITMPNTFIATIGAIAAAGAKPVFVDCN